MARPRTGQIPVQTTRVPQFDWDVMDELYGRESSQIFRDFINWHLRKPGAKLPARPSAEALELAFAKARHLELVREFALTLSCPTCKVTSGPCLNSKTQQPLEAIHKPRFNVAAQLYGEQNTADPQ